MNRTVGVHSLVGVCDFSVPRSFSVHWTREKYQKLRTRLVNLFALFDSVCSSVLVFVRFRFSDPYFILFFCLA